MSAIGALLAAPEILSFRGQRLQHALSDVEPRAPVDGLLQDQVELLRFGDLLDHAVRALEQRLQLLIAPQVEVFAVRALQALVVERLSRELLLARAAVALAHRHRILLELTLQGLDLAFTALQLLHAGRELLLEP